MIHIPSYLKKGDCIGIVCPAGYLPAEKAQTCIATLRKWGFQVKTGKTLGSRFHYFSGTDEERLADLQQMLDDREVKAILCGRGGYGVSRILDKLDFKKFKQNPKWIIGYSDITVLHSHLFSKLKTASLHAPMAAAFNDGNRDRKYLRSMLECLTGKKMNYQALPHNLNRNGSARGALVGGNLSLLTHLLGTRSALKTKDSLLFLEDVGEYIYNIDRMMIQLKRSGALDNLSGLIIGSFTELKDTTNPFGEQVYALIADKVKDYAYPVCFDFPVGHTPRNYALKTGVRHQLTVSSGGIILKETGQ